MKKHSVDQQVYALCGLAAAEFEIVEEVQQR